MTGGVITYLSVSHFWDARTSPACYRVILFKESNHTFFENLSFDVFNAQQVSFEKIY